MTPEETTAEETTAEETTAEETTPEEMTAKETTAKETTAKETTAKETTAKETTAKETTAEETTAKETTAKETTSKETTAESDFLPEAEFVLDNSPTIAPQKEVLEGAGAEEPSLPPPDPLPADIEQSIGASPTASEPELGRLVDRSTHQEISPVARPGAPGSPRLHILIPLVIAVLVLGAASTLIAPIMTPKREANANVDHNQVLAEPGANESPPSSAQTGQPDDSVQSELHLNLQQNASGTEGAAIPLGVRVTGESLGLALEISGLPSGMTISSGRPLGAGTWRILATDVADATIDPPPGFDGAVDLEVELRLADDTVIERGSLHREWLQRPSIAAAPIESAGGSAKSTDHETATPTPANDNVHPAPQLDQAQVDFLIRRSQTLISEGDVEAARILLRRAAEAHDARAALALGATYDPIMLAILKVHGVAPDVSRARDWYEKANEFGSQEAQERLKLLAKVNP
jgi:hypothetical protein